MEKIVFSYYKRNNKYETVLIVFKSREQILYYKNLLDSLLNEQIDEICLNDLNFIPLSEQFRICLTLGREDFDSYTIRKKKKNIVSLTLCQGKEEIITHICLLEPFLENDRRGFQEVYIDKYTIELSYKEQ